MHQTQQKRYVATRIALALSSVSYVLLYPRALWTNQAGWMWETPARNLPMENMLIAMYVVAGLFLLYAARDPIRFLPLIDYVIVANIVHGFVMLNDATRLGLQANLRPNGDVIGTFIVPVMLLVTHPRTFYLSAVLHKQDST